MPAHTTPNQASTHQILQNQSIGCAQMHRLLTPHLIKQAHTKPSVLVVGQDTTLRIRCPLSHCTLLHLAKSVNHASEPDRQVSKLDVQQVALYTHKSGGSQLVVPLLHLAKAVNHVCRSLPASQMDRCPSQMCNRWRCTPTSQEAASWWCPASPSP